VILGVLTSTLTAPIGTLRAELITGTFERIVVSPFGALLGVLSMALFPLLLGMTTGLVTLLFAGLAFGLDIHWSTAWAALPVAFLGAAALLGPAVLATGAAHPRLGTAYVVLGLLGGIVLYVIGFFYKIVPLLAWTVRFRGRMGKEAVPTVAQLYSSRLAHLQLGLMAGGVAGLTAGIGAGAGQVTRCGAVLFLGGVLVFLAQLGRISAGRAAPGAAA